MANVAARASWIEDAVREAKAARIPSGCVIEEWRGEFLVVIPGTERVVARADLREVAEAIARIPDLANALDEISRDGSLMGEFMDRAKAAP